MTQTCHKIISNVNQLVQTHWRLGKAGRARLAWPGLDGGAGHGPSARCTPTGTAESAVPVGTLHGYYFATVRVFLAEVELVKSLLPE